MTNKKEEMKTNGDIRLGFVYRQVPHITLKSIANNKAIDAIWEKHEKKLASLRERLSELLARLGSKAGAALAKKDELEGLIGAQLARAKEALQGMRERDFPLSLTKEEWTQAILHGVDVYDPSKGEVRSDEVEGIACWFVDTDYNEESFFVRQAYFLGASEPYKALRASLEGGDKPGGLGKFAKERFAPFFEACFRPHRRQSNQPPRRRSHASVSSMMQFVLTNTEFAVHSCELFEED